MNTVNALFSYRVISRHSVWTFDSGFMLGRYPVDTVLYTNFRGKNKVTYGYVRSILIRVSTCCIARPSVGTRDVFKQTHGWCIEKNKDNKNKYLFIKLKRLPSLLFTFLTVRFLFILERPSGTRKRLQCPGPRINDPLKMCFYYVYIHIFLF